MKASKTGALMRMTSAARLAGISVDTLKTGIKAGNVPLAITRVGRLDFVSSIRLGAWLHSLKRN